jgi:hypothetical protein
VVPAATSKLTVWVALQGVGVAFPEGQTLMLPKL